MAVPIKKIHLWCTYIVGLPCIYAIKCNFDFCKLGIYRFLIMIKKVISSSLLIQIMRDNDIIAKDLSRIIVA